jgi:8-oxo-dGTP pyrophosphatase MutT (NUDIX family)
MTPYRKATFPPSGPWDPRLEAIACPHLKPAERQHENQWFTVMNRGGYYTTEYREKHVIVLPVVEERAVVMVHSKRPVLGDVTLELPAGAFGASETPEEGAARELGEETGIRVAPGRMVAMPPLALSPNRIPSLLYVFRVHLARAEFDARGGHDDEVEGVELMAFAEVSRKIADGTIYVAAPIAIVASYLLRLARE